jgi:opacity protein-like surface antigen
MIARYFLWAVLVLLMASLLAIPSPAADLTFYVGGVNPGSINYRNVKTSLDNSPIFGFRLGTSFVPFFGMEHTLGFSSDFLFPRNVTAISEAKGFVYNSNLIVSLPVGGVLPYLTAGAGLIHQYGGSDMPVGTKFAFNYGGGVKFPHLVGPMGLRFDMRGYSAGAFSDKLNLFEVSGGVMLSIGK